MKKLVAIALIAGVLPALAQQPAATPTHGPTARPTPRPQGASLADIVRRSQQQARREEKKKKKSLGVISNESLKSGEAKKRISTVDGKVSAPAGPTPPEEIVLKDNNGVTEQQWRDRAASLRRNVAQTRERVEHLESEAKRLENDFYAWSDGNYRDNVIKPSWDRAKEDLKNARADLDQAETALSNLDEEARKAGAPPGWIR